MINKFLEGKKKYSVFLITILTAILNVTIPDAEAKGELTTYIPLLAEMTAGIVYLIIEGVRDWLKVKVTSTVTTTATPTVTPTTASNYKSVPTPPTTEAPPEPTAEYLVPFDPSKVLTAEADPWLNYEQYQDMYTNYKFLDLVDYHPDARIPLAIAVIKEGLKRLSKAWYRSLDNAGATETPEMPTLDKFDDYDGNENYKLSIMKLIPGCQYLPEPVQDVLVAIGYNYTALANANLLLGKQVKWSAVHTIDDIKRQGLAAVY